MGFDSIYPDRTKEGLSLKALPCGLTAPTLVQNCAGKSKHASKIFLLTGIQHQKCNCLLLRKATHLIAETPVSFSPTELILDHRSSPDAASRSPSHRHNGNAYVRNCLSPSSFWRLRNQIHFIRRRILPRVQQHRNSRLPLSPLDRVNLRTRIIAWLFDDLWPKKLEQPIISGAIAA